MRRLKDAGVGSFYRTGSHDLIRDFYRPCLEVAVRYDRAVGYFTSTSLVAASAGLRPFINRPEARMRLIASPALTDEDVAAIDAGYDLRGIVEDAVQREMLRDLPVAASERLQLLTWLIAHDRLDLKLAVVENNDRVGIYHEKLGIFSDGYDEVVFTGSANESASGLLANFESVEVFRSWVPGESDRVHRRRTDFDDLWDDRTPGLRVLTFPEAARLELLRRYEPSLDGDDGDSRDVVHPTAIALPSDFELRDYQKDAVRTWWQDNGRGIWEMATGTGKTVTALSALVKLWEAHRADHSLVVVVTVPYQHLADQWALEARRFGFSPILAYEGQSRWTTQLDAALATVSGDIGRLVFVIAVNATFCSPAFADRLRMARGTLVLVADEAHTAGAARMLQALPTRAKYRLGLSATPDRHLDPEGTDALRSYFGRSVYQLNLKQAIELGALVPYRYHPIPVELTEDELGEYVTLTKKIAAAIRPSTNIDPDDPPSGVERLLFQRARLVGSAANKVAALRQALLPYRDESHTLVYCADRTGDLPQLEQVLRLMGHDLRIRANTFTAREDRSVRTELLQRFASGELQALVAIRCLDEGVDIPATRRAFILASSQNPRQFVQRRGRVLRRAPMKSEAEIYDFLVSPPDLSDDPSIFELERRLVGRELMRAVELCDASLNPAEALVALRPLRERYDLMSLAPGSA